MSSKPENWHRIASLPSRCRRAVRLLFEGKPKLFHSEVNRIGMLCNRAKASYLLDRDRWSLGNSRYYSSLLEKLDYHFQIYQDMVAEMSSKRMKHGRSKKT